MLHLGVRCHWQYEDSEERSGEVMVLEMSYWGGVRHVLSGAFHNEVLLRRMRHHGRRNATHIISCSSLDDTLNPLKSSSQS